MTVDGRLFHALAAATGNARSPTDDLLVAGTTSAGELDDLKRWLSSDLLKLVGQVGWCQTMLTLERKDIGPIACTGSFPGFVASVGLSTQV